MHTTTTLMHGWVRQRYHAKARQSVPCRNARSTVLSRLIRVSSGQCRGNGSLMSRTFYHCLVGLLAESDAAGVRSRPPASQSSPNSPIAVSEDVASYAPAWPSETINAAQASAPHGLDPCYNTSPLLRLSPLTDKDVQDFVAYCPPGVPPFTLYTNGQPFLTQAVGSWPLCVRQLG